MKHYLRAQLRLTAGRPLLGLTVIIALAGCKTMAPGAPDGEHETGPSVLYAWVQQGAGTSASARAIVAAGATSCPMITLDGASVNMDLRTNSPTNFSEIKVCQYSLSTINPPSRLSIGSLTLPTPTRETDRILVLGDTGCRRKGSDQQPCTGNPAQGAWGFPALSSQASTTTPDPDLILHVGDYLYRESGCEVCGYNWDAWQADFFQAAEAGGLLRLAPWIFVRGNHEDCNRAWQGYFLFLAAGPWTASSCPTTVGPYAVNLDELDIYLVDTSSEDASDAQVSYTTVSTDLAGSTTNTWLTTHVPVCNDATCDGGMGQAFAASGLQQASTLKWLHVGHIHLFEHFGAATGQYAHPPQTITGGSGTELDSSSRCAVSQQVYCDAADYTYLSVDSKSSAWESTLYDYTGQVRKTFSVTK